MLSLPGFLFDLAAELRDEVILGEDLDPLLFRQLRFRAGMILGRDDQVIEFPSIGDIPTEITNRFPYPFADIHPCMTDSLHKFYIFRCRSIFNIRKISVNFVHPIIEFTKRNRSIRE